MTTRRRPARERNQGVSRRDFLKKGGLLAGTAVAAPLLPGCQPSPLGAGRVLPGPGPRERRTLHFDFSLGNVTDLWLSAPLSQQHGARLKVHNAVTRALFRAQDEALADIPDALLTHYLEDVDLPAADLQHIRVFGTDARTQAPVWAASAIHVPAAALGRLVQRRALERQPLAPTGKMRAYGIKFGRDQAQTFAAVNSFVTPWDTAMTLVYHHPDITSLNADLGASIINLMENLPCAANDPNCTPFVGTVAQQVAENWPASTSGGWATLTQATDLSGNPQFDAKGNPIYRYTLASSTLAALQLAVAGVKQAIFNDPTYGPSASNPAGANYHPQTSAAAVNLAPGAPAPAKPRGRSQSGGFNLVAADGVGTSHHGIRYVQLAVTDPANRTLTVEVKNAYLRFLGAYAQCYDNAGTTIAPPQPDPNNPDDPNRFNSSRAFWLTMLTSNDTILGIPLTGKNISSTTATFNVPAAASNLDLLFAGLGVGGEAFCPEAVDASVLGLIFNIGIPGIVLVLGIGSTFSSLYTGMWKNVSTEVLDAAKQALKDEKFDIGTGVFNTAYSGSIKEFLIAGGNVALNVVIGSSASFALWLGEEIAAETLKEAAPIIGVIAQILSLAADIATLGQSLGEILANPALYRNYLQLTMDTQLTINHDPNDSGFPRRASNYIVTATYDKSAVFTYPGTVAGGTAGPIVVTLAGVPAGGTVQLDIKFYSSDNWLVGAASFGPAANGPTMTGQVSVTIKEYAIPLTTQTQYAHGAILVYDTPTQTRQWQFAPPNPPAPTATVTSLSTGPTNALWALNGITIAQKLGMLGYGFQAGGQGVPACTGSAEIVNTLQNLYNQANPQTALKFSSCGFQTPAGIVYDRLGAANGRHFFLQPAADGAFDLRRIVLDNSTPFDMNSSQSWGRFGEPLDSLVIHPSRLVIGVSRATHTLQIVELPAAPGDPGTAPQSVPYVVMKGGLGSIVGRLDTPVAVAVSDLDGAIYVLEQGNARVQAFNKTGANVLQFQGAAAFPLQADPGGATYLDIAIEGLGYIYILSYTGNGAQAGDYHLDVYNPDGTFLCRTSGVAAARLAVDTFRNIYVTNYAVLTGAPRVEPSLSQWWPHTPQ